MPPYVHPHMQDSGDVNGNVTDSIDNDMLTCGEYPVFSREFGMTVADLRMALDCQQCLVYDFTIGVNLRLTPSFKRVLEYIGKILFRLWGKYQRQIKERHQG